MIDAPAIAISDAAIQAIVARHGLGTHSYTPLVSAGHATSVYLLDDAFVLRVPRDHPALIAGIQSDAIAIQAALAAGVRTPRLIALDDRCELLPVPYGIYERVHGVPLSALALAPEATPALWHELGGDLARLHHRGAAYAAAAQLRTNDTSSDPRPWLAQFAAQQTITAEAEAWLRGWLDRLERFINTPTPARLCHGDVNVSNIMVDPHSLGYLALIDWGGAGWGDPTWGFVPVSLRTVPALLVGYRAVAALDQDHTAEARIVWHHLQFAIYSLHRQGSRAQAGAMQRLAQLQHDLRMLLDQPTTRWLGDLV